MVDVMPFRAWRYDLGQVGNLSDVTAPPYDVIGPEQQTELYEKHPCNVIRLILNRSEPGDASTDERYRRAASFLQRWQQDGTLMQERADAIYVYHQEFIWEGYGFVRKGFLARIRLEPFGEGNVFPHEQTMSGPKADRLLLTKACKANLSPVFGLFPDQDGSVQRPLEEEIRSVTPLEATDHLGVIHRMWPVTDRVAINAVRELMKLKPVFIADGHHRYETACNYREWLKQQGELESDASGANFVLMMFVGMDDEGLAILPTHRLVSGLPELTLADLRVALEKHFEIVPVGQGEAGAAEAWRRMQADGDQNVFGFCTPADGEWVFARVTDDSPMEKLAPEQSEDWRGLGVSLLHRLVLDHLIVGKYPSAKPTCKYVHLLDEVNESVAARECELACLVQPAQIEDVEKIASRFEKMPPKSTYFYPKLLSGLVFNPLD